MRLLKWFIVGLPVLFLVSSYGKAEPETGAEHSSVPNSSSAALIDF